jgi:hypothetical protein
LIQAFKAFLKVDSKSQGDEVGLTFTAQAHTARVMPHPTQPSALLVEVDVCAVGDTDAAAPLLMHRLNYLARFSHGWSLAIDADDMVVIYTTRSIARTDAGALEALIVDGLERAGAIEQLWLQQSTATPATAPSGIGMMLGGIKA